MPEPARAQPLLAVPNVAEGRDGARIRRLRDAFGTAATVLDAHSDAVHNRSVFTLAGDPDALRAALVAGADAALEAIDMRRHEGAHPCIGALDVCPVVWLAQEQREPALEAARAVADAVARRGVPVFLYGELASAPARRERAFFRSGGISELARRMATGELHADAGPQRPHPSAGATLVTARRPLAAFNLELDGASESVARAIAAELREAGGGLPGVRAIGLMLEGGVAQVSTNVEDPLALPLARVVERARELAEERGARISGAEIVGLVPRAALAGFPAELPIGGFDAEARTIEAALANAP